MYQIGHAVLLSVTHSAPPNERDPVKRTLTLVLAAVIALSVSGCSGTGSSAASTPATVTVTTDSTHARVTSPRPVGTPGCVVRDEFAQIQNGMSMAAVSRIFRTHGSQYAAAGSIEGQRYVACGGGEFNGVWVTFTSGRVSDKSAIWPY